jgi:DNA-binding NtrC family response regulator
VRELQNTLLRAAIWSDGELITKGELEAALLTSGKRTGDTVLNRALGNDFDLKGLLDEVSRHYLERALVEADGNKTLAAELTGLKTHQTLTDWMKRLRVEP